MPILRSAASLTLLLALIGACVPDFGREHRIDEAFLEIVDAEDARPSGGAELERLIEATGEADATLRRAAVRALGRLERPGLTEHIALRLDDPDPAVRATAANAVAQAFQTTSGDEASGVLLARVEIETDPVVRGVLARSIGRLTLSPANRRRAADAIVAISVGSEGDAPLSTLVGVVLGLEALIRAAPDEGIDATTADRLEELSRRTATGTAATDAARVRALAISALGQARRLDHALIDAALDDGDDQVGAVALRFAASLPPEQRAELLDRAVRHPSLLTVIEAFRVLGREPRTRTVCTHLFGAAGDSPDGQNGTTRPVAVRLQAIDALATPCPDRAAQRALLAGVAAALDSDDDGWQPAAHALVALGRLAPDDVSAILPSHVANGNSFVRTYAARAAGLGRDVDALRTLAGDEHPNVRTEALVGLFELEGQAIDELLLAQLDSDDPQLLMTVAGLLGDSPPRAVVAARILDAFDRISAAQRETWRDARRALLARAAADGDGSFADRLEPYLLDYDSLVAADAADALEAWTGRSRATTAVSLPRAAHPSVADLRAMDGGRIVLHMRLGGAIEIELDPYLAPTNVHRFWRLARDGWFDGLTFHRWAPNFVIQGGSPGANEYAGDGPFTRDEVGLPSHWRGTVGISTRGHDTGDGQIFVNLMDNVRLDHTYTVVGTVVAGMDVVDRVLEGAVIERAEVVEAR